MSVSISVSGPLLKYNTEYASISLEKNVRNVLFIILTININKVCLE